MKTRYEVSKLEIVKHVYYWNARLWRKTAILAGPFLTAKEAELTADIVSPIFIMQHPEANKATFGVLQVNAPGIGEGDLNHVLPPHLMGNLAVDTGLRN
jgi:hypothetical protein